MCCAPNEKWDLSCFSRALFPFSEWPMPSATEPKEPAPSPDRTRLRTGLVPHSLARWNRKLHFYSGLFLLFFVWLFAFSGLILNHPTWSFAESWNNRKETNYVRNTTAPEAKGDL